MGVLGFAVLLLIIIKHCQSSCSLSSTYWSTLFSLSLSLLFVSIRPRVYKVVTEQVPSAAPPTTTAPEAPNTETADRPADQQEEQPNGQISNGSSDSASSVSSDPSAISTDDVNINVVPETKTATSSEQLQSSEEDGVDVVLKTGLDLDEAPAEDDAAGKAEAVSISSESDEKSGEEVADMAEKPASVISSEEEDLFAVTSAQSATSSPSVQQQPSVSIEQESDETVPPSIISSSSSEELVIQ